MSGNLSSIRAPGKAFLCGEYAVLHGAPALIAAIDACVIIDRTPSDSRTFFSDLVPGQPLQADAPAVHDPPAFGLVRSALSTLHRLDLELAPPATLHIHSAPLRQHHKLGLGSSSAVAAALACALLPEQTNDDTVTHAALTIHHDFQGGQGSGGDVLAALHGGLLHLHNGVARHSASRPTIALLPTTQPADTPSMIRALQHWADQNPNRWAHHLHHLRRAAETASNALLQDDLETLFHTLDHYATIERQLTEDSRVPIITPEISTVLEHARLAGWAAKPSGAGGGDLVVAMAPPNDDPQAARTRLQNTLANTPWAPLPLGIHPVGALQTRTGTP